MASGTPAAVQEPVHLVLMGISGSGKTTLAERLAKELDRAYAEADEFHSPANIERMRSGTPLTDADRAPWLESIRDWMDSAANAGGTIVTCSALKRSYRDLLRQASGRVFFLHVICDPAVITDRMEHRLGHFMPASLVPSQLATLEELGTDEDGAVLVNSGSVDELVEQALTIVADL
ncbi:gluconokinase [Citricoccus zhacaiensis]|uniref:Gluconokinase n=1 Tax=Citricoccus zhacaiensis TaxID=489142 RepID=A0ABQ2LZH9_9MICC|nr:gluconokinase [Citricoccus zhacaiensis]GGO45088.1 gluconokinase [Citricoccus zhacaiensis]